MHHFEYNDCTYPIRDGLVLAHRNYWHALARPGTWFSGAQRVAIAAEVRNAVNCPLCAERKRALSPNSVSGEHLSGNELTPIAVDAVHRVITDQARITQAFVDECAQQGLSEEQYVELVGIAVTVFSIDEFSRALGVSLEPLPEPVAGEPTGYRPVLAERGTGFVSMLPVNGAVGKEADLWKLDRTANVLRALTLVPNAMREWMGVGDQQYLSMQGMGQFTEFADRALNRMQIELVAGRVSSYNECFY